MKTKILKRGGWFTHFSKAIAFAVGQSYAFGIAVAVVLVWALTGPLFHYSDTWQLVINTSTTIVTFLMVFLIQNTQNRDAQAIQLKLDELIRAVEGAHTAIIDSEELTDHELCEIKKAYATLANAGRAAMRKGGGDTGAPEITFPFDQKHDPEN